MFKISPKANENYLTKIVKISNVQPHPNADKLLMTTIDGNTVVTGTKLKVDDVVVYFPLESIISNKFLSYTNSYEAKEMNANKEVKGFFPKTSRVRAVKLRGILSNGYIVPINVFLEWLSTETSTTVAFDNTMINKEFDYYDQTFISKKYIPIAQAKAERAERQKSQRNIPKATRLVDNQFRLHSSTQQLGRNLFKIDPNSLISITAKLHGSAHTSSVVLTKKQLKWYEKLLVKLGIDINTTKYDNIYSSRNVVKNRYYNDKPISDGYYGTDIWGVVNKELKDFLQPTMTIYGEIVGYIDQHKMVQKDYDYGCNIGEHDFYAYRITTTTPQGNVVEWSAKQVQQYCKAKGLKAVPELYYGTAQDLYPISPNQTLEEWQNEFLIYLKEQYLEKDDPLCKNKVPDEGIVLRVDQLDLEVYKLKSERFKEHETKQLDKGITNIEDEDQQLEEEVTND